MDSTDEDTQTTTAAQTDDDDDDGQTQESIMASTTVNGTPFSVLMSQAIKMKSAQEAPTRSKYDTYPTFYKNSVFPYEEVINARKKTFGGRMNDALELKEAGNKAFEEKRYLDAIHRYEMTLSVFKYLNNTNDNWKTEGIRDDDIEEIEYTSFNLEEMEEVAQLQITCYVNIAVAAMKGCIYPMVIEACDEVLKHDSTHVKSLYLKSKAMITPKSAGAYEDDIAIQNLRLALKHDPKNKIVVNELKRISSRRRKQLKKDKAVFGGLFKRGHIYHDNKDSIINDTCITKKRDAVQSKLLNEIDFDNPSEVMVKHATRQGIDLKNHQVIEMLKQLQSKRLSLNVAKEGASTRGLRRNKLPKMLSFLLVIVLLYVIFVQKQSYFRALLY